MHVIEKLVTKDDRDLHFIAHAICNQGGESMMLRRLPFRDVIQDVRIRIQEHC